MSRPGADRRNATHAERPKFDNRHQGFAISVGKNDQLNGSSTQQWRLAFQQGGPLCARGCVCCFGRGPARQTLVLRYI